MASEAPTELGLKRREVEVQERELELKRDQFDHEKRPGTEKDRSAGIP